MDKEQILLAEMLKLKMFLVNKLSSHTFAVQVQEVLDKVNQAIEAIDKNDKLY